MVGLPGSPIKKNVAGTQDGDEERKRAGEEMKKKGSCRSMRGLGEDTYSKIEGCP